MKKNENIAYGFCFMDAKEFKEAKREAESIEYIKANTDLNDRNKALKLYHKLVDRKTFKSIIGYVFLKELQNKILQDGIVTPDNLPNIIVEKNAKIPKAYANTLEMEKVERHKEILENYRIRHRNARIINFFLVVIIIAMIAISLFRDRTVFVEFENQVIDKYASWEEELQERENALKEKEEQVGLN